MFKKDRQIRANNDRQQSGGTLARTDSIDNWDEWITIVTLIVGRDNLNPINLKQLSNPPSLSEEIEKFAATFKLPKYKALSILWSIGLQDEITRQKNAGLIKNNKLDLVAWGFSKKSIEKKDICAAHILEDACIDGLKWLKDTYNGDYSQIKWDKFIPATMISE